MVQGCQELFNHSILFICFLSPGQYIKLCSQALKINESCFVSTDLDQWVVDSHPVLSPLMVFAVFIKRFGRHINPSLLYHRAFTLSSIFIYAHFLSCVSSCCIESHTVCSTHVALLYSMKNDNGTKVNESGKCFTWNNHLKMQHRADYLQILTGFHG